jgi:hypothetical protein
LVRAGGVIESLNSNNVLAAMCGTRLEGAYGEKNIYEKFGGETYYLAQKNVQVFKRGEAPYSLIDERDLQAPSAPGGLQVR